VVGVGKYVMRITCRATLAVLVAGALAIGSSVVKAETQAEGEARKAAALKSALDEVAAMKARSQQWAEEADRAQQAAIARDAAARIAAEKQRQEESEAAAVEAQGREQATATAAAQQAQRLADPRWARPLWSAQYCRASRERAATVAEIAKEKKLARLAGVIDLEMMRQYQNTIRDDDEEMAGARRELAAVRRKLLSCTDRLVVGIADCLDIYTPHMEDRLGEACRNPEILEYARLTKDPRDL
jgi:hypothetical protein